MQDFNQKSGAPASAAEIPAVVLCGGAGTRLSAVLEGVPKALAPVAGRPFLDYVLQKLRQAGLRQVVLCVGVRGEAIKKQYRCRPPGGLTMDYSEEREPLGTGGALQHAKAAIPLRSKTLLVLNGDTFLDVEVDCFLEQHLHTASAITVALVSVDDASRFGTVQVNARRQITKFVEKSAAGGNERRKNVFINAGWYLMQIEVLRSIPQAPPAVSLEYDVLPQWIGRGLHGHITKGFFIDIGVPEDLRRAQNEFARAESGSRVGHATANSC
jgi:NDP-sugar pyrophosphorylase family protein